MRRPRFDPLHPCALLVGLAWLAAGASAAQTPPAAGPSAAALRAVEDGLEPVPLHVEALGLSFRPPVNGNFISEKIDGRISVSITEGSATALWNLRINIARPTRPGGGAEGQVDEHLARLTRAQRDFRVISNEPVTCGGVEGRLCFVEQALPDRRLATGWLVLPRDDGTFLVIASVALAGDHAALGSLFERSYQTISQRHSAELSLERRARLDRGRRLLASSTPERLQQLIGQRRWTRIYRPATERSPEVELGYSFIEVASAPRDAISGHSPGEFAGEDEGLLLTVRGRVIADAARGGYYDSAADYWMSWDQSSETWSVRVTVRSEGEARQADSETGIRNEPTPGNPKPMLTLIKSSGNRRTREPYQWQVPEVYLSQALGWILGNLMPRTETEPSEYAYYTYNFASPAPSVSLRVDRWAPVAGTGTWELTSRLSSDTPAFVTSYGADGTFLRRVHADGSLTEPIELRQLEAIWRRKGLTVETRK